MSIPAADVTRLEAILSSTTRLGEMRYRARQKRSLRATEGYHHRKACLRRGVKERGPGEAFYDGGSILWPNCF